MKQPCCSICYDEYTENNPPLLLYCCKGANVCEGCVVRQLELGSSRCFICHVRPTRTFLANCKAATPSDYLAQLTLLAEAEGGGLSSLSSSSSTTASSRDCGQDDAAGGRGCGGGVFREELAKLSAPPGDSLLAQSLSESWSGEAEAERARVEREDAALAQRLAAEQNRFVIALPSSSTTLLQEKTKMKKKSSDGADIVALFKRQRQREQDVRGTDQYQCQTPLQDENSPAWECGRCRVAQSDQCFCALCGEPRARVAMVNIM